jgi:hypothetical protein
MMVFTVPIVNGFAQSPVVALSGTDALAEQPTALADRALSDNVNTVQRSSAMPRNSMRFDVNFRLCGEAPGGTPPVEHGPELSRFIS